MRNRILRGKGLAFLAVALTALLLTACALGPSADEEKVVKIGYILPLTGAPSAPMQGALENSLTYLKYFEEGGIPGLTLPPGVSIELIWGDSAFQADKAISIYERMRDDAVIYYTPAALETTALKSRFDRDGMATICMNYDEAMMYPPGPIFSVFCTESEKFAILCDWIMENWQEGRPPRVAVMGADSASGRATEVMGPAYAQSIGIEMLPFEAAPYMALDVSPQLLRIREREADFVYISGINIFALPIMRDAERLGLTGTIRFGSMENGQSPAMLALGAAVEGYFSPRNFPWYEEVPICRDVLSGEEGDTAGQVVVLAVMIKAISMAIDNVGYENLDGRAVREAMYVIKDFDPHGMGKPITYTPEDHRGSATIRMYEVQNGKVVPVTDWRKAPMFVPEK